ncbi:hypothetical protein LOC68_09790 [Blastopirellula sp. JC732]|uniref:Uncharacterized protein n=1 Tax=Blastopirellula sediminis TaxID=2894196 RepID=A0A9X1ML43_9BACT|nr:hypothetical protein [Blastopirellula sediminis]MCC9608534.1 hypothetical protein [Blastopirellula sediminis]MCC9628689.1 hypothetical protein [Blastopirellula sediminis]
MKPNLFFLLMALMLGAAGLSQLDLLPTITPPPENPGEPDLLAAFRESDAHSEASQDAKRFAELCDAIAAVIEYDAARPEPHLRSGVQLENLRMIARETQLSGGSYAVKYPHLGGEIKTYLDSQIGVDGGALSDDRRRNWIAGYRQLAKSAHYAADYLAWKQ